MKLRLLLSTLCLLAAHPAKAADAATAWCPLYLEIAAISPLDRRTNEHVQIKVQGAQRRPGGTLQRYLPCDLRSLGATATDLNSGHLPGCPNQIAATTAQ